MRTTAILKCLLVTTLAAPVALFAACAATTGPSRTSPLSDPGAPHPDTKAEPGHCNFYNYYHDESKNAAGAGKCATDCDCDGMRSCKAGACEGAARAQIDCNSPDHRWNEAWNTLGAGRCASDCECDGARTCQGGTCQEVQSASHSHHTQ